MNTDTEQYLQMYQGAQQYLKLSHVYAEYLGGLRWSAHEDALAYADGRSFAFNEAIAEFVDGYAGQGRVIPFGYLLHWLDLLRNLRSVRSAERLQIAFYEAGCDWRFAGALAAAVTDNVPDVPHPPDLAQVSNRLRNRAFPIRWFTTQFHETQFPYAPPPIEPGEFEAELLRKLGAYSGDDLRTWLKTGRGPIRQAERIAEELPLPRSLARRLAKVLERPRLAGVETYVAQLVGALTLPPRRFLPEELPVGGYTDIVTKGQIEHLLPTQFALDEIEFLRRYADRELLYFRREEPPVQNRQELVVLLDQGVRTWGDVRLVLTAGALAYGKQSILRKTPFRCAATSTGGALLDPAECSEETLGQWLEASDLSLNPGLALERVLETPSEALRDIVLLTHPRNLRESDVLDAARRLGAHDRLFAVTLDAHGQAEVVEIRHGAAIRVRQFRVDFKPSTPKPRREKSTQWTGAVESIPFPFRLGTESHITHFDFDYDGEWLITVSGQGTLHRWKLDGSTQEMLPRACGKEVMKKIFGIIGVTGGFVLLGTIADRAAVAHFDVVKRIVRNYPVGFANTLGGKIYYFPADHRIVVKAANGATECTIHLLQQTTTPCVSLDVGASTPVVTLPEEARGGVSNNRHIPVFRLRFWPSGAKMAPYCGFNPDGGEIELHYTSPEMPPVIPISDGKRCFQNATVATAGYAGNTLALSGNRPDIGDSITLVKTPDGAILREYPIKRSNSQIKQHLLSFDGQRIALLRSDHRVEVDTVRDRAARRFCTRAGGYTTGARFFLGDRSIVLNLGTTNQLWHQFNWESGVLRHHYARDRKMPYIVRRGLHTTEGLESQRHFPGCCAEDHARYVDGRIEAGLWYVLDRFGQLTILDADEQVLAMFIAFRDRFAVWLPDGTRLGSLMLSLGPPTDGAAQKIAQVLLCAAAGE